MSYSVDEKVKFNSERKTPFGYGYCWGVRAYRKYPKADKDERRRILAEIDDYKREAQKKTRSGECAKGFMCAVRDCANERKSKSKQK